MAQLKLHLFGAPRMELNGAPVVVDTRKATALMAFLAVSGGRHQRDTLAGLLWPDYDQSSARAALRRTLSTLNRALGGETGNAYLDIAREAIAVLPDADIWLDVAAFHRLASPADHGHGPAEICHACLESFERAAALYREPFLAGFNLRDSPNFEEWQFFQEETLRRELSSVLEKLVRGLEAAGQVDAAVQYARRWLALDTLLEEAHRQLMLLYTHSGQRNAALRQYRECVRILDQELGVAPLEETTRLYQAILNREPLPEPETRLRFLDLAEPRPAPADTHAQPAPGEHTVASLPAAAAEAPAAPVREPRGAELVGREMALARLRARYRAATAGQLVALDGEAGIGKTRLAQVFLAEARAGGARVIQARCYPGETGLAYAPFIEGIGPAAAEPGAAERLRSVPPAALAEAARLLPELTRLAGDAAPLPLGEGAQARFFESLRQVIHALLAGTAAGNTPGVLFLDDLHWADSATLNLLAYLARRLAGMPMLLVCAWRSEQSEAVQALERLVGDLAREDRAERLSLERLGLEEIRALVRAANGAALPDPETVAQRLFQESEGLPFVAVEYLRDLRARAPRAGLAASGGGQGWEMPAGVRDLLHSRLAGIDDAARQLLGTAAVLGRSFDFNTLRETSGRSDLEALEGLERLLAAGLVLETSGPRQREPGSAPSGETAAPGVYYDFTHEKLRALMYDEISLARRRLLHRRAADALARTREARAESAALVASHYQQAGLDDQSAEYYRLAGERAQRLYANVEAMAHYQSALAAGHPDAAGLHEAIGDLHTLHGHYGAALSSYQTAAALCTPGCLGNLEHKLGSVHLRLGEWELAESHYQASLEAAGEPLGAPAPFFVQLFADRSLAAHARGDLEQASALAARALELAQASADPQALAQAHNVLGVLARARGDHSGAASALRDSLHAAEQISDPLARIAALNNLALVAGESGEQQQAIDYAQQALALCQRRGDRHREAALHNNLADLLHRSGREEEAMQQLKQAVIIFAEIGMPDPSQEPAAPAAIWKLTEW